MMTDGLTFQTCPKCGKENLTHMTHCVHCGSELEALYQFDGQIDLPEEETKQDPIMTLPFLFDDLDPLPKSNEDDSDEEEGESQFPEKTDTHAPDWLERVRQRVRDEKDASGELTKGIASMQERLDEEVKDDAESQYQAWLNDVREKATREKAKQAERLQPSPVDEAGVPEWLRRIRALHPAQADEPEAEETSEVWTDEALEALRKRELGDDYIPPEPQPGEEQQEPPTVEEEPKEDTQEMRIEHNIPEDDEDLNTPTAENAAVEHPETRDETADQQEQTGFVMVGEPKLDPDEVFDTRLEGKLDAAEDQSVNPEDASTKRAEEKAAILQDLVILRGQHEKVALLKSLISDEGKSVVNPTEPPRKKKDVTRLVIGLILILVTILSILLFPIKTGGYAPQTMPQLRFGAQMKALNGTEKVLVVLSYYSASAPELETLAAPVLAKFEEKGLRWNMLTLRMDGLWQAESLYEKAGVKNQPAPVYVHGGQFAMLDLTLKTDPLMDAGKQNPFAKWDTRLEEYDLVLLVSDSSLMVRGWLEQVMPNSKFIKTLAIVSQKDHVALQPYFDSGHLLGYLSGPQSLPGEPWSDLSQYRAYQMGLFLMTLFIVLAAFLIPRKANVVKNGNGVRQ